MTDDTSVFPAPPFLCDTHTHTARCGHAAGADEEFIEAALRGGLDAIAVTDHLPFYWLSPEEHDPSLAMAADELPRYVDAVVALQARYRGRIEVLLGVEADYIPGHEGALSELLARFPFDVVLGSVHRIDDWWVDAPNSVARYRRGQDEVDRIWSEYTDRLIGAARSRLFDVLAHLDLPKKFGHRATRSFGGRETEVIEAIVGSGTAVELSSAGRRKVVGEDYPAPGLLQRLAAAGVGVVISSDAHAPAEVGYAFDELPIHAARAGFSHVAVFRRRERHSYPVAGAC